MEKKKQPEPMTLKGLRESLDFTQVDVANALGVSAYTIILWEQGKKVPAADKFYRLAQLYSVSSDYLAKLAGFDKGQSHNN